MDVDGPRRGTRDNGLRCASYVAIADLDPRVADALLSQLRDNGIAAYAAPTPGASGGYLETRLPDRPIDRLWVDDVHSDRARAIVNDEREHNRDTAELDFDKAWQQVLSSLQSTPDQPVPSWPVTEDLDSPSGATSHVVRPATLDDEDLDEAYDGNEHFVPPPAPPIPRLRAVTFAALASIVVGLLILATDFGGGSLTFLAIIAIIGGVASLVWNMRNGPPTDSGWDDGAVV
jgi:hypothetical protein